MAKVIVLGGGYSGLACLIELFKKDKDLDLHLVDAHVEHCKITNLHKTFRQPLAKYQVPFAELAERFNFSFHRAELGFTPQDLVDWQAKKKLPLAAADLPFDWLVVATGADPVDLPGGPEVLEYKDLYAGAGKPLIEALAEKDREEPLQFSLVGGGATGVQIVFELHEELRRQGIANNIRLIDLNPRLVPDLPEGFHSYITKQLRRKGIDYLPGTVFLRQEKGEIHLEEKSTGKQFSLPSDQALLFPGVAAAPTRLAANAYGQVVVDGQELASIFTVGDCSSFDSAGLNHLTAQAALRKGKLVARNIRNLLRERRLQTYRYQEKGYLISLGGTDAIGWIGLHCNLIKGFPAIVIKEAMETQYDLFVDGIDTYLDFP